MSKLFEKILKTIQNQKLIKKNDKIVIAVSGGGDSTALLHILYNLKKTYNLEIHILHINHLIRGKESHLDAEFVKEAACNFNLPFHYYEINVPEFKIKHKLSLEEAARISRQKIYSEVLKLTGAEKLALGHTLDDQAETIIMRLLRGAGGEGLKAMSAKNGDVIRPLIEIKKKEILNFLKEKKVRYRLDKSNLKKDFTRNKIRLDLIPKLKKEYNPNLEKILFQTSQAIGLDNEYLNQEASLAFNKISKILNGSIFIKKKVAEKLHPAILVRVFKVAINTLQKDLKDIGYTHYQALKNLITAQTGKKIILPGGIEACAAYDNIIISRTKNKILKKTFKSRKLKINGATYLEEINLTFYSKILKEKPDSLKCNPCKIYADLDKCGGEIIIRSRNKGDRFCPLGLKGNKKIKKLMIDSKIPHDRRDIIPILEAKKKILWVAGLRMDERFKVRDESKKILMVTCCQGRENNA